jgi:LPXTG-motif cell wall-anchored protein
MSRRLRSVGIVAVIALVALFTLVPFAGAAPRAAETRNVAAKDFLYEPKTITVTVGDTVMWTNEGAAPHTVTSDEADGFDSGNMDVGATFSELFDEVGTFAYFCKYHGAKGGTGMAGTVVVVAAAAAPEAPTAAPAEAPTAAPEAPTAAPAEAPTAAPAMGDAPSGSVDAADQPIVDSAITVANVTAGQDGWIVAHLDEGGKPGKVIGQTAVKKGDNRNVAIKLSENVAAGGKLWPMLHIDAGAIGTYEFPGPDAPVIVDGNIVMKQISVTAAAAPAPAPAPAPAQPPRALPTTGGESAPVGLLLAALGLILAGALVTWRLRRA